MYTNNPATPALFGAFFVGYLLFVFVVTAVAIAGQWKTFSKAGQPGWAAIIPIYNIYVMTQIARRPGWWVLLTFIPAFGIVILVLLSIDVADAFDKSPAFGVGLGLLAPVFYCILGFGKAEFRGTADHTNMDIGASFSSMGQPRAPQPGALPPPGWYDAPDGSGTRWWNGHSWAPPAS